MKKFLVMVAAAMMATMNVNAQSDEPRHEIGLSYGLGASAIIDLFGPKLSNALFDSASGCDTENDVQIGTIAVEYFYHCNNPRLAVGGILAFAHYGEDVVYKKENIGERTRNYFTIMPAVKYDWIHKDHFALYSKVGAGVMFMTDKQTESKSNKSETGNETFFMWQASLLGVEAGGEKLRGFCEVGVGEQGIILAGIKYKF